MKHSSIRREAGLQRAAKDHGHVGLAGRAVGKDSINRTILRAATPAPISGLTKSRSALEPPPTDSIDLLRRLRWPLGQQLRNAVLDRRSGRLADELLLAGLDERGGDLRMVCPFADAKLPNVDVDFPQARRLFGNKVHAVACPHDVVSHGGMEQPRARD